MTLADSVYAVGRRLEPHDGRVLAHHLRIALGSEAELQTQLELAVRVGVIAVADGDRALAQTSEVGRMLRGMLASTQRRANLIPDS